MKVSYIDLKRQHVKYRAELMEAITSVMDHANFILPHNLDTFEQELANYCGTDYALGLNSGTDALFLSFKALGIGPGDEVILPPNTFLATASSIIATGATPIFADCLQNQMINPDEIKKVITSRTKAIVPVHLSGKPADMDPINAIAKHYGIYVIEDAAQAIGATYNRARVGSLADVGCFSFHPVKTLNACGDGGAIVTNNKELYTTIKQLRNIGLKNRDEFELWGYNSRLDGIQAAILNVKLKYLNEWNEQRGKNAAFYINALKGSLYLPERESHEQQVYHTFVVQHPKRDELMTYLKEHGIDTKIHYPIPIHLQSGARDLGYKRGDFPVCEKVVSQMLSLPIHQDLRQDELDYVAEHVKQFCSQYCEVASK